MLISFSEITLNFFQLCRTYFLKTNFYVFPDLERLKDQLYNRL